MADKIPEKGGHIPPHIARKKPDCDIKPLIPEPCDLRNKGKRKASIIGDVECLPVENAPVCPEIKTIEHVPKLVDDPTITVESPPGESDLPPPLEAPTQVGNNEIILSCPANQPEYDSLSCTGTEGVPAKDSDGNFPKFGSSIRIAPNTFFVLLANYADQEEAQNAVDAIATTAACEELDCWFVNDEELGSCEDILTEADLKFLHSIPDRDLEAQITEHAAINEDYDYENIEFVETTGDSEHSMVKGPGMLDGGSNGGNPTRTPHILVPKDVFLSKVSKDDAQSKARVLRDENLVASCYKCNPALKKPCPAKAEPKDGFVAAECSFLTTTWDTNDVTAYQFKELQGQAIDFLGASQCITINIPIIDDPCEPTFELVNPNEKDDCGSGDSEYKQGDPSGPFDKENECDYKLELPKIPCPCGYKVKLEVKQAPGQSSVGTTIVSQSDDDCTMHMIIWIPEIPDFDPDIFEEQWFIDIVNNAVNAAAGSCIDGYNIKLDLTNPNCTGTPGTGDSTKPINDGNPLCTDCDEGKGPSTPEWSSGTEYKNGDLVSFDGNCYQVWDADLVKLNEELNPESGLGEGGWEIGPCGDDCFNYPSNPNWTLDLAGYDADVPLNVTVQLACTTNQTGDEQTFPEPNTQYIEAWWEFNGGAPPAWSGGELPPAWIQCRGAGGDDYANGEKVSFNGNCYTVVDEAAVQADCVANPATGAGWAQDPNCGCPTANPYSLGDVVQHGGKCYEVINADSANNNCTQSPDNNPGGWSEVDCGGENRQIIELDNPSVSFNKSIKNISKVEFRHNGLPSEVPVWIYVDQASEDGPCDLPLRLEFPDVCGELKTTSITEAGGVTPKDEDGEDVTPPADTGIVPIKSSKKEDVDGEGETNKVIANLALTKRDTINPDTGEPCCEFGIKADNEIILSEGDVCEDLDVKGVDDSELNVKVKQLQKDPNGDGPETVVVNTLVLRKVVDENGDCKLGFQALKGEGGEPLEEGEGGGTAEAVNEILLPPENDIDPCDMIDVRDESDGTVRLLQTDPENSDPEAEPVEKGTLKLVKFEEKDDDGDVIGCSFGVAANVPGVAGDVNEITLSVGGGDVCAAIEADTDTPRTINVYVATNDGLANPIEQIGALSTTKEEKDGKCAIGLKYDGSASDQDPDSGELIIPCAYVDTSFSEVTLVDEDGTNIGTIKLESSKDANNNDVFKLTPSSITIPTMSGYEEAEIDVCTPSGIERKTILVKQ
tara:strand:- start:141 stop:3830 length:3690 start_codon:yes stop_codon:yes gene_type:complete